MVEKKFAKVKNCRKKILNVMKNSYMLEKKFISLELSEKNFHVVKCLRNFRMSGKISMIFKLSEIIGEQCLEAFMKGMK